MMLPELLDGLLRARFDRIKTTYPEASVYGEVKSYMRYEAEWLRSQLDARVLFACRDRETSSDRRHGRTVYTDPDRHLKYSALATQAVRMN